MHPLPLDFGSLAVVKPPVGRPAAYAFAGFDPAVHIGLDGKLIPSWEAAHIVRLNLPRPLTYIEPSVGTISKVAVHVRAAGELMKALVEIENQKLGHLLEPYAGGFEFRRIRNTRADGTLLSMHALGLALDFDPKRNEYNGDPEKSRFWNEGQDVIRIFEHYGWYWGGRFGQHPDAQHFQFAVGV